MKRTILAILLLAALQISGLGQVKRPVKPVPPVPFNRSLQAVVVTTDGWDEPKGRAQRFSRRSLKSPWKAEGESFAIVVGKFGLAWGKGLHELPATGGFFMQKQEGDGRAPAGIFRLTSSFGSPEKPAAVKLPYTRLKESTECVDDPKSFHYNRVVDRFQVGIFDWKSSEKMLAVGAQYELGIFVAHNNSPVVKGAGSCIFLHVWENSDSGTAGCTAMAKGDLEAILNWAEPSKNPVLIQLPSISYTFYQKSWKLPKL
jgi:D-alanyl-D-alanine dipeptidase